MSSKITISGGKVALPYLAAFLMLVIHPCSTEAKGKLNSWRTLSRPEKCWTFFHPFKSRIVYRCGQRARFVTDSLEKAEVLKDGNGGQLDAFRHAYWMALMVNEGMEEKAVRKVGGVHEKGNYVDFKTGRLEDGERSDSMASVMDVRNNEEGIRVGKAFIQSDKSVSLIRLIIMEIWDGDLFILKKDDLGNYRTCQNRIIDLPSFTDKWSIPKCLVKSNEIAEPH